MDFYDKKFLIQHVSDTLQFYDDKVIDSAGGYNQSFYDDGSLFNEDFKQLVSSSRIIVNYALGGQILNQPEYFNMAKHGLLYLQQTHWQKDSQLYAWTLRNHQPEDMTQQAYGWAFVLLAYATAKKVGLIDSDAPLKQVYQALENKFWQAEYGLYADEISSMGELDDYRGQNSNMHMCEAMIAAYEATNDQLYLKRALLLAENIVIRQAAMTDGLVWEHFTTDFQIDWDYNRDDPKNLYRPWGFQPGHQTEWSKLLLILNRYVPADWLVEKACNLFDRAWDSAWDKQYGGLVYGFDTEGKWCDDDKYFWVQSESFATAALLYQQTDDDKYLDCYNKLWEYSWQHFVDHKYGAWYRILKRDNTKYSNEKSAAGAKCDYHTIGACLEVLRGMDVAKNA